MSKSLQKMVFFDLLNSLESTDETSKTNRDEALFTLNLIQFISQSFADNDLSQLKGRIGIITPYKAQVMLLKDLLF